jgi:hypothetical protein
MIRLRAVLAVVVAAVLFTCTKPTAPDTASSAPRIVSLSATSALPTSPLTLTGTGFGATNTLSVRFSDSSGYQIDVQVLESNSTSAVVCVPPYFASGTYGPGTVSVQVIQSDGSVEDNGVTESNSVAGFQIQDLPASAEPPGSVTLGLLNEELACYDSILSGIRNTPMDTLNAAISANIANLETVVSQIQWVVQNPGATFSLGSIRGSALTVGSSELLQSDRLILCLFATVNRSDFSTSTLAKRALASVMGCPDMTAHNYQEVRSCILSQQVQGVIHGFKIFLGIGAVSVGVFALAGASSALATAGLLYIGVMSAGTQLSLGALLKDVNDPAAYQFLKSGIEQTETLFLDPIKNAVVSRVFGETVGILKNIYDGVNQIRDNVPSIAGSCTYELSSPGRSFDSLGGSGTITVMTGSGCPWTAEVDNVDWISVTSNSTGSGPGTVSYSVQANTTTLPRNGDIFIGIKSFSITQTGRAAATNPAGTYVISDIAGSTTYNQGVCVFALSFFAGTITITITGGEGSMISPYTGTISYAGTVTGTVLSGEDCLDSTDPFSISGTVSGSSLKVEGSGTLGSITMTFSNGTLSGNSLTGIFTLNAPGFDPPITATVTLNKH